MNKQFHTGNEAFSLFELVIVMAIIGIIAAIAQPHVANAGNFLRVNQAAQRIAADIAMAKRQARLAGAAVTVSFAPDTNSYAISGITALAGKSGPYIVVLSEEPYKCQLSAVDCDGNTNLVFNGFGEVISGAPANLLVVRHSCQRTITINQTTGYTKIQ